MPCDPDEHEFVTQTSYSIEIETDSAIVEEGTKEKRCKECGKTPEELDEFVTDDGDSLDTENSHTQNQTNKNVETEDDAIIMTNDNSELQSAPTQSSDSDSNSSSTDVPDINMGEQTDDAYVMGTPESNKETPEVDDELEDQWGNSQPYTGPILECPNCGFETPKEDAPQYPGDSCPECQKAYLREEE